MKKILILFLISIYSFIMFAQNTENVNDNYGPKKGTFSVGINATPLLNYVGNMFNKEVNDNAKSLFSNNKLQLKYFVTDKQAIRFSIGNNITYNSVYLQSSTLKKNNAHFMSDLGYEFRKTNNGRLHLLYGSHLHFSYLSGSVKEQGTKDLPANILSQKIIKDYYTYAIAGFMGVEYFVFPSISIGGESSYTIGYTFHPGSKLEYIVLGKGGKPEITRGTDFPKSNKLSFLQNFSGSLYVMFHF